MLLEPLSGPGCGDADHPDGCLHDVKIAAPLQVPHDRRATDYEFHDIIANAFGCSFDDAPDDLKLKFMAALCRARDVLEPHGDLSGLSELQGTPHAVMLLMRERLGSYLQGGGSILDAPQDLTMTWAEVLYAASIGRMSGHAWRLTLDDWADFERMLDDPSSTLRSISRRLDTDHSATARLVALFRGPGFRFRGPRGAYLARGGERKS